MYNLNSNQLAELAHYLNQYNEANKNLEELRSRILTKKRFLARSIKRLKELGVEVDTKAINEHYKKGARLRYLNDCSTSELTEALCKREGIESINVAVYKQYQIVTDDKRLGGLGPAIIILNRD